MSIVSGCWYKIPETSYLLDDDVLDEQVKCIFFHKVSNFEFLIFKTFLEIALIRIYFFVFLNFDILLIILGIGSNVVDK